MPEGAGIMRGKGKEKTPQREMVNARGVNGLNIARSRGIITAICAAHIVRIRANIA